MYSVVKFLFQNAKKSTSANSAIPDSDHGDTRNADTWSTQPQVILITTLLACIKHVVNKEFKTTQVNAKYFITCKSEIVLCAR